MTIQPYLFFDGCCEAAIDFYKQALGAEVTMLLRFSDSPEPHPPGMLPPGSEHKIMHSSFRIGGTEIMASDGQCAGTVKFEGFSLSISVPDAETAQRRFAALADGGQIHQPLIKTFFASSFGVVRDRFNVSWMIVAAS